MQKTIIIKILFIATVMPLLISCTGTPAGVKPVEDFDKERYTGKWYEIQRLDHRFERHLTNVTAEYRARKDGKIGVINRGFDTEECEWKEIEGSATFRKGPHIASLKVVFFWPFAGGYHVIKLDDDYEWALVSGPSRSYLWILARQPHLDEQVRNDLIKKAKQLGYPVEELIRVDHSEPDCLQSPTSTSAGN